jgi:hypothetical protein
LRKKQTIKQKKRRVADGYMFEPTRARKGTTTNIVLPSRQKKASSEKKMKGDGTGLIEGYETGAFVGTDCSKGACGVSVQRYYSS